jgi:hypothetical protein
VALGYQTEGCVLYKAENRAEENPLPGRFLVASWFQNTRKTHAKRTQNVRKLPASYQQVTSKLNHAEKLEHRHDDTRAVKPEHVHEVKNNSSYHFVTSSVTSSNP